jgi:hypothetical protein
MHGMTYACWFLAGVAAGGGVREKFHIFFLTPLPHPFYDARVLARDATRERNAGSSIGCHIRVSVR